GFPCSSFRERMLPSWSTSAKNPECSKPPSTSEASPTYRLKPSLASLKIFSFSPVNKCHCGFVIPLFSAYSFKTCGVSCVGSMGKDAIPTFGFPKKSFWILIIFSVIIGQMDGQVVKKNSTIYTLSLKVWLVMVFWFWSVKLNAGTTPMVARSGFERELIILGTAQMPKINMMNEMPMYE